MNLQQMKNKEHYEIEKELATRLRESSRDERKTLYVSLYDEFNRRVPIYTEIAETQISHPFDAASSPQWRFLRRFLHKNTVFLEIGAGNCAISQTAARFVKKVYALEVSKEVTKHVQQPEKFELILFDGFSLPVPTESINVVYSDQVLEHIHPDDVYEHLMNIHNVLAPKGMYVCITPNRLNGPHDISRYFDDIATGFHLREYTNSELSDLFKRAGFSTVQAYTGVPALYVRVPLVLLKMQERLLDRFPRVLSRRIASISLPWCVRLVGVKR